VGRFTPADIKVVVVASHPDDEIIGLGSLFNKISNISFIHTTNGAPDNFIYREGSNALTPFQYSELRFREFENALYSISVLPQNHIKFNIPDQQTSFNITGLTLKMADTLLELKPDVIFLPPFEGGHPDHDSTAFAVHNAAGILKRAGINPLLIEYTMYFNKDGLIQTGEFSTPLSPEFSCQLNGFQQSLKRKLLQCFRSQKDTLKYFHTRHEKFRIAPKYDFTKLPCKGFYDLYNWGIDSITWLTKAKDSAEELNNLISYEYT
jgi:N-acetylglucosamine malate deacetylase 2